MDKDKDLKFIKGFSKITIAGICKDLKIDKSNIWSGRGTAENISKVKNEIKKRIESLD